MELLVSVKLITDRSAARKSSICTCSRKLQSVLMLNQPEEAVAVRVYLLDRHHQSTIVSRLEREGDPSTQP